MARPYDLHNFQKDFNPATLGPAYVADYERRKESLRKELSESTFYASMSLDRLAWLAHTISATQGHYDDVRCGFEVFNDSDIPQPIFNFNKVNYSEKIALIHSEVSELLETLRTDEQPSKHVPEISAEDEEAADILIRLLDYCRARNINIAEAYRLKSLYNLSRPYKHGKRF